MTTFTKVWAVKSPVAVAVGDKITVTLKSGAFKEITAAAVFPQPDGTYIVIPEGLRA